MTKIAQLHNGVQIHFPDETPDAEMDKAVQRHLGGTDPAAISAFMKAVNSHTKTVMDVQTGVNKIQQDEQRKLYTQEQKEAVTAHTEERHHSEEMQGRMHHVQATEGVGEKVGASVQQLREPLDILAVNSEKVPELVMALNNLSATMLEVGKAVIAALYVSKELSFDENGKPKGLYVKRQ